MAQFKVGDLVRIPKYGDEAYIIVKVHDDPAKIPESCWTTPIDAPKYTTSYGSWNWASNLVLVPEEEKAAIWALLFIQESTIQGG